MARRSIVLGVLALTFGVLGTVMELNDDGPILVDTPLLRGLEESRTPSTTRVVRAITNLGGHEVMIPLCIVLTLAVGWKRRRAGVFMTVALLGSAGLNEVFKRLFARPRPTVVERITSPRGLSFPSGHSQATMAFALTLVLVVWREAPRYRRIAPALFLFPLLVGGTRAYLGVHYPSDIVSGWSLGAFWVVLADTFYSRASDDKPSSN
ncbi:MAG: phosphatase PAP2 family protein [Myxococcota bacterium]